MKPTFLIAFILLCAHYSGTAQQQKEVKLSAVPHAFTWVNNPKTFTVTSGNSIQIVAQANTDQYIALDGSYYANNAPKLLFKPDSNFIFSARLSMGFDSVYDAGSIIIYSDSSNWAKLLFERSDEKTIHVSSSVIKDKITDDNYHSVMTNKQVYLKVAKAGKVFCFYYSTDGKHWNIVRTFTYKTEGLRLGFYAQSPKGPQCTVDFTDISYQPHGFTNFFTGE
jgi:regulation of enolase protein 1 (concanavalin A-like superfamily)